MLRGDGALPSRTRCGHSFVRALSRKQGWPCHQAACFLLCYKGKQGSVTVQTKQTCSSHHSSPGTGVQECLPTTANPREKSTRLSSMVCNVRKQNWMGCNLPECSSAAPQVLRFRLLHPLYLQELLPKVHLFLSLPLTPGSRIKPFICRSSNHPAKKASCHFLPPPTPPCANEGVISQVKQ